MARAQNVHRYLTFCFTGICFFPPSCRDTPDSLRVLGVCPGVGEVVCVSRLLHVVGNSITGSGCHLSASSFISEQKGSWEAVTGVLLFRGAIDWEVLF